MPKPIALAFTTTPRFGETSNPQTVTCLGIYSHGIGVFIQCWHCPVCERCLREAEGKQSRDCPEQRCNWNYHMAHQACAKQDRENIHTCYAGPHVTVHIRRQFSMYMEKQGIQECKKILKSICTKGSSKKFMENVYYRKPIPGFQIFLQENKYCLFPFPNKFFKVPSCVLYAYIDKYTWV